MLSEEYSATVVCAVLGCARSSYYYHSIKPDDRAVRAAIETVAAEWPT
jgi:hypothetical protein